MEDFNAAMQAGTSPAVQMWMNWMMVIFLASVLFVWRHTPARVVLGAFFLTGLAGLAIWGMTGNIHLLGIAHLVIWLPLAVYLWKKVLSRKTRSTLRRHKAFFVWVCLVFATIAISLMFDVRDLFLVFTGAK